MRIRLMDAQAAEQLHGAQAVQMGRRLLEAHLDGGLRLTPTGPSTGVRSRTCQLPKARVHKLKRLS